MSWLQLSSTPRELCAHVLEQVLAMTGLVCPPPATWNAQAPGGFEFGITLEIKWVKVDTTDEATKKMNDILRIFIDMGVVGRSIVNFIVDDRPFIVQLSYLVQFLDQLQEGLFPRVQSVDLCLPPTVTMAMLFAVVRSGFTDPELEFLDANIGTEPDDAIKKLLVKQQV